MNIDRYCRACGLDILQDGITCYVGKKFCDCANGNKDGKTVAFTNGRIVKD